jgi:DNA primase
MRELLEVIGRDTMLKRIAATHGGEYAGPCPWCGGTDRFHVWPRRDRWACLGREQGRNGCGRHGDAIQYIREREGVSYAEACQILGAQPAAINSRRFQTWSSRPAHPPVATPEPATTAPGPTWQTQGWALISASQPHLLDPTTGARAKSWLNTRRGLSDEILHTYGIGYNPSDRWETRSLWGLPPETDLQTGLPKRVWLPRGIVIPWMIGGELWRVNIRRPAGEPKYIGPAGFANGLFNADKLRPGAPVALVEGEIDAMTIDQGAGDLITPVATGSTAGSRCTRWIAQLALASVVLVAYDIDENGAGEKAADWWLNVLSNAKRWRPLWSDVNDMAVDGADLRQWVQAGIGV